MIFNYLGLWLMLACQYLCFRFQDVFAYPKFQLPLGFNNLRMLSTDDVATFTESNQVESFHLANGEHIVCSIPTLDLEFKPHNADIDLIAARSSGLDLLSSTESGCIHLFSDYWTYIVCYGGKIYQLYADARRLTTTGQLSPEPGTAVFILGEFTGDEKGNAYVSYYDGANHLVLTVGGGSQCTLTGEDRQTELHYYCDSTKQQDVIVEQRELRSCYYMIRIATPRLCADDSFLPKTELYPRPELECFTVVSPELVATSNHRWHNDIGNNEQIVLQSSTDPVDDGVVEAEVAEEDEDEDDEYYEDDEYDESDDDDNDVLTEAVSKQLLQDGSYDESFLRWQNEPASFEVNLDGFEENMQQIFQESATGKVPGQSCHPQFKSDHVQIDYDPDIHSLQSIVSEILEDVYGKLVVGHFFIEEKNYSFKKPFTIVVPILDQEGDKIGNLLIAHNGMHLVVDLLSDEDAVKAKTDPGFVMRFTSRDRNT